MTSAAILAGGSDLAEIVRGERRGRSETGGNPVPKWEINGAMEREHSRVGEPLLLELPAKPGQLLLQI